MSLYSLPMSLPSVHSRRVELPLNWTWLNPINQVECHRMMHRRRLITRQPDNFVVIVLA